jgi:carbohydrate-selective porin OprB
MIEPGHNWNIGQGEHPGRVSVGYWRLTGQMEKFDGGLASGAQGFYTVAEQSGWRHPWMGKQGERKLATFFQYGYADSDVSPFTHHVGAGAVLQAPFTKRAKDSMGIAATSLRFSTRPGAGFDYRSELIFESYYRAPINKYFALIQDFQFLHQPGGEREEKDCPVITTRMVLSF